jgi:hypothetical protein
VRQAEASHHKSLSGLSQLLRGRLPAPLLLPVSGLAPLRGWATNGGNRGCRLFVQERLLESSHQILCPMMSPELIGLLSQTFEVGEVSPGEEDPQLPGQPAQEEAGEEDALLCPSRANLQHGRHQLGRLPTAKGRHVKQSLRSLEVR